MRPRSFRNSDHSSFLFLLILGIIKIPFVSFQGSNGRLRPCGVVWQLPILGMCQGVNVSFSPSGVVNYHESLFLRSDFATFGFRRWRDVLSPHRKINSAMLFSSKGCPNRPPLSKDAVKHRSLYLKPVSQSATVVLQNCDDEVMNRYPIFNLPSHFTTVAKVKNLDLLWSHKSRWHKKSFPALTLKRGVCFLCNHCPKLRRRSERWTICSP